MESKLTKMNTQNIEVEEMMQSEIAFMSSSRIRRSQLIGNHQSTFVRSAGTKRSNTTESLQSYVTQKVHGGTAEPLLGHNSPREEFISKMRNSGEEILPKCQSVIRMEVQNGVAELEELIDVMKNYWENWKTAEKETSKAV